MMDMSNLSRVLTEVVSESQATQLAKDNTDLELQIIPQELLKKYIMYARSYCQPTISQIDSGKVQTFYSELRRASQHTGQCGCSEELCHLGFSRSSEYIWLIWIYIQISEGISKWNTWIYIYIYSARNISEWNIDLKPWIYISIYSALSE